MTANEANECEWLPRTSAMLDGELAESELVNVQQHVVHCEHCTQFLSDSMSLAAVMPAERSNVVALQSAKRNDRPRLAPRWIAAGAGAFACAAAVVVWLVIKSSPAGKPAPQVAMVLAPTRSVEVMLSGPSFAQHRPYEALRGDVRRESFPLATMAELEKQGRTADLFSAFIVAGNFDRAAELASSSAVTFADRAALALVNNDAEAALVFLYDSLRENPTDIATQWNLGLAAAKLGLWRTSHLAFSRVASSSQKGWAEEAKQRALASQAEVDNMDANLKAFQALGDRLLSGDATATITQQHVNLYPANSRFIFYDAVRMTHSDDDIAHLQSLAVLLDQQSASTAASDALQRASKSITARAKWIDGYRSLRDGRFSAEQSNAWWSQLKNAGPGVDDLQLGASILLGKLTELPTLQARVFAWHDAWFNLLLARLSALQQRDPISALRSVLLQCPKTGLELRCAALALSLAEALLDAGLDEQAEIPSNQAVQWFQRAGSPNNASNAQAFRADIWRLRGRNARARAEFAELALNPRDCATARYAAVGQANLALSDGDWQGVRQALPVMPVPSDCQRGVDMIGVSTAVDLARRTGRADDVTVAQRWIVGAQQSTDVSLHDLATVASARLRGPSGDDELRTWVSHSDQSPDASRQPFAAGLRAWSYATLLSNAGALKTWNEVLKLGQQESSVKLDQSCHMVASLDDDLLTVAMHAGDFTDGTQVHVSAQQLGGGLLKLLPSSWLQRWRPCTTINVVARPPLHGRADLMPADRPWQFIGQGSSAALATAPSFDTRLLVAEPKQSTDSSALPALTSMSDSYKDFTTVLTGNDANSKRVLAALSDANYVELHVHGVATANADTAKLLLSPDDNGDSVLTARQIRSAKLRGQPIVILAACRAAIIAPHLRQRWSLPDAFLAAGARAVIATDLPIPDLAARRFFAALRAKLRAGASPAASVAVLRAEALEADKMWSSHVMVFATQP
jgi:cellulose synthase operon protein C